MCPQDKAFLQDLKARGVTITAFDRIYFEDPYYDGKAWTTKTFEAGGTTNGNEINIIQSPSGANNASTLFHEGTHTAQPNNVPWREQEYDAYVKEDQWRISHGLPPHHPDFRTPAGKTNDKAIRAFVDKEYPGVTVKSAGKPPESIKGKDETTGNTIVRRADGTTYTRKPKKGDSFPGDSKEEPPGGRKIDMNQLQCP